MGSSSCELNNSAQVISYEEYHPFGSTSFHTVDSGAEVSAKRYRYTGKERDDETGLYYYGARYYACWLGRWTGCDPKVEDGWNLYVYVKNNSVRFIDLTGKKSKESVMEKTAFESTYSQNLEKVANKLSEKIKKNEDFGRAEVGEPKFDQNRWEISGFEIKFGPSGGKYYGFHNLVTKEDVKPSDAIKAVYEGPEKWKLDCAEFTEVCRLGAILETVGSKAFDKMTGGGVRLQVFESTLLETKKYLPGVIKMNRLNMVTKLTKHQKGQSMQVKRLF